MVPQTAVEKAVVVTFQIEMPQIDFLKLAKIDIKKHFLFLKYPRYRIAQFSDESNTSRGSLRIHKDMSKEKGKLKAFLLYIRSGLNYYVPHFHLIPRFG